MIDRPGVGPPGVGPPIDLHEPVPALLRRLRTSSHGLSQREAARRLMTGGPNRLPEPARQSWVRAVATQLVHPLALVLWAAAGLSVVAGTPALSIAIALVIVVNALFSFLQERQAQRAVAALNEFVPNTATAIRDREQRHVAATDLVVGDLLVVEEGERVSADARLIDGAVEVDMSPLTGESVPVTRTAGAAMADGGWLATPTWCSPGPCAPPAPAGRSCSPPARAPSWAASPR